MLYVATGRALRRDRGRPSSGRRSPTPRSAGRAASRLLAAPVERRTRLLLPDRPGPVRDRQRQVRRDRPRPRDLHDDRRYRPDPLREQRLHLLRARAGARSDRDLGRPARLHGLLAARLRAAVIADDGFSKLLATGLTFAFALQTFINVGGLIRESPLTGITLPFVSYGGSSIVANFVLLAGLLLVSNRANAPR